MKVKVIYTSEIELDAGWYPDNINTLAEIIDYEIKSNDGGNAILEMAIEKGNGNLEIVAAK